MYQCNFSVLLIPNYIVLYLFTFPLAMYSYISVFFYDLFSYFLRIRSEWQTKVYTRAFEHKQHKFEFGLGATSSIHDQCRIQRLPTDLQTEQLYYGQYYSNSNQCSGFHQCSGKNTKTNLIIKIWKKFPPKNGFISVYENDQVPQDFYLNAKM